MKTVVALIPAYNAENTIEEVICRVPRDSIDQLIVVDDGSKDRTCEIIRRFEWVTLLRHEGNRGYGAAQITLHKAALDAGADAVVILHADLGHCPEEIPSLLSPILADKCDIVQGSRILGIRRRAENLLGSKFLGAAVKGPMPSYKYIANRALTTFENVMFGAYHTDYHTGFRACSRKGLLQLKFDKFKNWYLFDTEFLLEAHTKGLRIREVPVSTFYDPRAGSNVPGIPYGLGIVSFAVKVGLARLNGSL